MNSSNILMGDIEQLTDAFDEQDTVTSLEDLIDTSGITVGCYQDIMSLKRGLTKYKQSQLSKLVGSEEGLFIMDDRPPESYVETVSKSESTVIITQSILMDVFCGNNAAIGNFISQLDKLPADSILNVVFELGMNDLNYVVMEAGLFVSNLIKQAKCTKVFNFGSQASIADLMIAMCCDEVYVGNFASVSITKADNGSTISRFMLPVYEYLIKTTYDYWTKLGLFTQEEVADLFTSEADNSIQLLSPEIRKRLSKNSVQ